MSTSIRQTYEKTDIYKTLCDEYEVFDSYVDFFIFSACLGYYKGEYTQQGYEGENEMLWMHVGNSEFYQAICACIGYQHTEDPDTLVHPDEQLEIMAQYAHAGAEIAEEEFGDIKGDPTDAIVNYFQNHHDPDEQEERQTVLGEIVAAFNQEKINSD